MLEYNDFSHQSAGDKIAAGREEWMSEDTLPDPDPLPEVKGWNIIVRPVPVRGKTKGSIILPTKVQDDMRYLSNVSRVLKLGPLCYNDERKFGPEPWCKEGDLIVTPKFSGAKFTYKGIKLNLISETDVLMVLKNSEDIDPTTNL